MKLRTFKSSEAEYERWKSAAETQGLSWSAWLRRALNERAALEAALEREREE